MRHPPSALSAEIICFCPFWRKSSRELNDSATPTFPISLTLSSIKLSTTEAAPVPRPLAALVSHISFPPWLLRHSI